MCKKMTAVAMVAAFAAVTASADISPDLLRDYSAFDEDTTAVVYGTAGTQGAAYYYGFEVEPTSPSVNLDGVSGGSVGDFHTLNDPAFDTVNGLASGTGAGEALLRTDFNGSLWRSQFLSLDKYVIEVKLNILGDGPDTTDVIGLFGRNSIGGHDLRIGENHIKYGGATIDSTFDNTGWHTWRLAVDGSDVYVFRDGTQVGGTQSLLNFTWDRNFIGDFSGSGFQGGWQMEYVVMDTIPEPATIGMVAAFGGAILFIRRKMRF